MVYIITREVLNNDTIGSNFEVNPYRKRDDFTTNLEQIPI